MCLVLTVQLQKIYLHQWEFKYIGGDNKQNIGLHRNLSWQYYYHFSLFYYAANGPDETFQDNCVRYFINS